MTINEVNNIFKEIYPDGEILQKNTCGAGYKFCVFFNINGKAYHYSCKNSVELLQRLGFDISYIEDYDALNSILKKDIEALEEIKENINKNGVYIDLFFGACSENESISMLKNAEAKVAERKKEIEKFNTKIFVNKHKKSTLKK